jgi:hypothetical protein
MSNATEFDDMYGSKFFGAADLHGRKLKAEITDFEIEDLRDTKTGASKRRIVLTLVDTKTGNTLKPFVVNKTNATTISEGGMLKDPADWVGTILELFSVDTQMGPGVRCVKSKDKASERAVARHGDADTADAEDDGGQDNVEAPTRRAGLPDYDDPEFIKRREVRALAAVRSKARSRDD